MLSGMILSTCVSLMSAPPQPLSGAQRAAAFPAGNSEAAAAFNKAGLDLRKKKDGVGAARAYAAAINADATYAPARFNFACELSRHGEVTAALDQLSELVRLGTPESLKYAAAARFDEDFKAVWNDQRFREIQSIFTVSLAQPLLAQLCRNPAKVLPLIDESLGAVVHVDNRDTLDKPVVRTDIKKGREVRAAAYKLLENGGFCDEERVGGDGEITIVDFPLSRENAKGIACYEKPSFGEWDQEHTLCFGVRQGRWTLILTADYDGTAAMAEDSPLIRKRDEALKAAAGRALELLRR